ncbi:MAG: aromatic amino acid lyase, partial [Acidobacteria bacterium]|nr:aromatic amino acid lyase [Acidobacteriota bacterium]
MNFLRATPVVLDGSHLSIADVFRVARHGHPVELAPEAEAQIARCRAFVEREIADGRVMYGINTGIGELSEVVLSPEQIRSFQRYIIYSHSAGCGTPLAPEVVRAAICSRINVLARGHSGPRLVIVRTLLEMLNKGVTPVVYDKGSVGACGDLSPMSQMALVLIGEGEAYFQGQRMPGK